MYDGEVLMIAMAATALLVIALTLFAFQVLLALYFYPRWSKIFWTS